jgi:hypothetical protein
MQGDAVPYSGTSVSGLRRYFCPVPDFSIDSLELGDGAQFPVVSTGPEIWLVIAGSVHWTGLRNVESGKGQAVFVLPGEELTITAPFSVSRYNVKRGCIHLQ